MNRDLPALIGAELEAPVPPEAAAMGAEMARRFEGAVAVLFYGSVLRTGDADGVLDFYVLTERPPPGLAGMAGRMLWPDVSFHEWESEGRTLRAKVASMTLDQFRAAASGTGIDTTIWTRFVQPAALIWTRDADIARQASEAVVQAAQTAARFAAALGPSSGAPDAYWRALFRQTYAAEFRVEPGGRESQILDYHPGRYDAVLTAAWRASGLAYDETSGGEVSPRFEAQARSKILAAWRTRRRLGKPLNLARLVKATFTFQGAARYAAWKIERHTGLAVPLTPWRERHPLLAAPGVFWRLMKARRAPQ